MSLFVPFTSNSMSSQDSALLHRLQASASRLAFTQASLAADVLCFINCLKRRCFSLTLAQSSSVCQAGCFRLILELNLKPIVSTIDALMYPLRIDRLAPTLVHVCGFIWEWTQAKSKSPLNIPGGTSGGGGCNGVTS